jgi:hypothetical protein
MSQPESAAPDRRLFGLCLLTLAWSVLVLQAGGFTTSIQAGMAFLDWPLSNGSVNPPGWLTEIEKFAEHSHRLAATGLGLLCVVIAVAHRLRETRPVVRRAAYALVGLVVLQGLLGGLRVLLDRLNIGGDGNFKAAAFAVGHAVNAQLTLALLAFIALAHSAAWHRAERGGDAAPFRAGRWAAGLTLAVIVGGAVMRQGRFTAWVTSPDQGLFLPSVGEGVIWAGSTSPTAAARCWRPRPCCSSPTGSPATAIRSSAGQPRRLGRHPGPARRPEPPPLRQPARPHRPSGRGRRAVLLARAAVALAHRRARTDVA